MESEKWKRVPIKGLEDKYEVSNFGRLKTLRFKKVVANGRFSRKGYELARMTYPDHKTKSFFMHRLVALTFIPNPNNYPQVNHIDCDKKNNHVSNLEWCTNLMNLQHARENGIISGAKGEKNSHAVLTEKKVLKIRDMFARGITRKELSIKFDTKMCTIKDIVSRRSWRHI